MGISCVLRQIPCLSDTVKGGIERIIFRLKHLIYVGKHFIHNLCRFFEELADFIENAELEHKCGCLLSHGGSVGLNVKTRARPA